jgi:periplasmic divalent cation tolerance protein
MDKPLLVYTTLPDADTALSIGEELVSEGLTACINVLPGIRSVYRWKGAIEHGEEVVVILKSRAGLRERLHGELKARHPYETPSIFFIEPASADDDTLSWIVAETGS